MSEYSEDYPIGGMVEPYDIERERGYGQPIDCKPYNDPCLEPARED